MKLEPIGDIREYLARLEIVLQSRSLPSQDTIAEVQDHLLEAREALIAAGRSPVHAEREAIARFGSPEDFSARLDRENSFLRGEATVMRWTRALVTLLAGFTSLFTLVGLAFTLIINSDVAPIVAAQRVIFGLAVVSLGALTMQHLWFSRPNKLSRRILYTGALGFIAVGSVGTIGPNGFGWVGTTQDPEYYIGLMAMAMVAQGILTIWSIARRVAQEA